MCRAHIVSLFFSFTAPTTLTVITHLGDAGYVACGKLIVHIHAGTKVNTLLIAWLNEVLQNWSLGWLLCWSPELQLWKKIPNVHSFSFYQPATDVYHLQNIDFCLSVFYWVSQSHTHTQICVEDASCRPTAAWNIYDAKIRSFNTLRQCLDHMFYIYTLKNEVSCRWITQLPSDNYIVFFYMAGYLRSLVSLKMLWKLWWLSCSPVCLLFHT